MPTLDELGVKHQTDKSSKHHGYLVTYEQYLSKWRDQPITLIEAGIGGYEYADRGGQSAKMWREYFPAARIITFDLHRKLPINAVEVLQGSQDDPEFIGQLPACDLFIDDASHINPLTIRTFELAWPKVKSGGLYIVEDAHTSYWELHGYLGQSNPYTDDGEVSLRYFSDLIHQMNLEYIDSAYHLAFLPTNIAFIHFYPKLIIVGKK